MLRGPNAAALRNAAPFAVFSLVALGWFAIWPIEPSMGGKELSTLNEIQLRALDAYFESIKLTGAVALVGLGAGGALISQSNAIAKAPLLIVGALSAALVLFGVTLFMEFYQYRQIAEMLSNNFLNLSDPTFGRMQEISIDCLFLGFVCLAISAASAKWAK
jgi:hypothetical protein